MNSVKRASDFLISSVIKLHLAFPNDTFSYKVNTEDGTHCIYVSSSNLYNSDEFIEYERQLQLDFGEKFSNELLLVCDDQNPIDISGVEVEVFFNKKVINDLNSNMFNYFKSHYTNVISIVEKVTSNSHFFDRDKHMNKSLIAYSSKVTANIEQPINNKQFKNDTNTYYELAA